MQKSCIKGIRAPIILGTMAESCFRTICQEHHVRTLGESLGSRLDQLEATIAIQSAKFDKSFTAIREEIRLLSAKLQNPSTDPRHVILPGSTDRSSISRLVTMDFQLFNGDKCQNVVLDDPVSELEQLQETNGIVEYHERFELLRTRLMLTEDCLVKAYLEGLEKDTQMNVKMFQPKTVDQCYLIGKLYERAHPRKKSYDTEKKIEEVLPIHGSVRVECDFVEEQNEDVSPSEDRVLETRSSILTEEIKTIPDAEMVLKEPLLLENSHEVMKHSQMVDKPTSISLLVVKESIELTNSVLEANCVQSQVLQSQIQKLETAMFIYPLVHDLMLLSQRSTDGDSFPLTHELIDTMHRGVHHERLTKTKLTESKAVQVMCQAMSTKEGQKLDWKFMDKEMIRVDVVVSEENYSNRLKYLEKKGTEYTRLQRHKIGVSNCDILTKIEKGAIGEVRVFKEEKISQVNAMKTIMAEVELQKLCVIDEHQPLRWKVKEIGSRALEWHESTISELAFDRVPQSQQRGFFVWHLWKIKEVDERVVYLLKSCFIPFGTRVSASYSFRYNA